MDVTSAMCCLDTFSTLLDAMLSAVSAWLQDEMDASTMSQNRSRSTSAESRSPLMLSKSGSTSSSHRSSGSSNDGDHEACQFAPATRYQYSHSTGKTEKLACNSEGCLSSGAFNQELCEVACEADCQVHQRASCNTLAADFDAMTMHQLPRLVPLPPLDAPVLDGVLLQHLTSPAMPERLSAEVTAHAAMTRGPTTLSISSLLGAVSLGSE
eukprot:CAMPEP_0172815412 /NCGR_PEP_ID=MMETSP1075-20121228/11747_1 /TAXON_ID=2916 /ORGANISM="Ceratium fusus, Strain PA161109" /LENGTH=210 /DNA_ID=CAMNT_0013655253 /DNA_START=190 /DNA_END=820 /DNA_ORIENTATION=-